MYTALYLSVTPTTFPVPTPIQSSASLTIQSYDSELYAILILNTISIDHWGCHAAERRKLRPFEPDPVCTGGGKCGFYAIFLCDRDSRGLFLCPQLKGAEENGVKSTNRISDWR